MKRVVLILMAVVLSLTVMAQDYEAETENGNKEWLGYDVEGLCIGQRMNYKQFVAKFGKPDRYKSLYDGEDKSESYYVGEDYFHFEDNGIFLDFILKTTHFAALTNYIKDGIRVGDKLSKLDNFKYGKPVKARKALQPNNGNVKYVLFEKTDCPLYLNVKDGIITVIYYSTPV